MDKKYVDAAIKATQELVKIKSVQDTPVPNGPFGQGAKECLEKALELAASLGFKTKNLDGYCGYAEIGEGDELFAIIGHLDVVPEGTGWDYPPYSAEIVDNAMYGRGTWDDKGPVAMCLYTLKALMDNGYQFKKKVRLIMGCNEESGTLCVKHYIEKEGQIDYGFSPDADFPVIFGEKTINGVLLEGNTIDTDDVVLKSLNAGHAVNAVPDRCEFVLEYKSADKIKETSDKIAEFLNENNIKFEVSYEGNQANYLVHGKAMHGSAPQYGVNAASYAIVALSKAIKNEFVDFYAKYIGLEYNGKSLGCYAHDEYGDIAVNIGIVKYENNHFVVAINSRLPFNTNSEKMIAQIKETIKDEKFEAKLVSDSKGFIFDKDSKMIQIMQKAYQEVTGDYESKPQCIAGGTYARVFNNCVAYGAEIRKYGKGLIHSPNESIRLDVFEPIMDIYYKAIPDLLEQVSFKK